MLTTLTSLYAPRLFALLKDRRGVSAMEYAVLAIGIVVAVAAGAATLGGDFQTTMGVVGGDL
jgi:Flp pilus assembly pilin Flp